MKLKILCVHLSLISFVAIGQPAAAGDSFWMLSFADTSCGTWAASASNPNARAQYYYWFRGFVTGFNYSNPSRQISAERMPSQETMELYVDKYCRDNPLNPFVSAGIQLVKELALRIKGF